MTSSVYPTIRLYEAHITGDISFAARQYFSATNDEDWLLNEFGGELIYQTAQFWASRAIYNNQTKQYEILSKITCERDAHILYGLSYFLDRCDTTG